MIKLSGSIKTFPRKCLPNGVPFDSDIYVLSNAELKKGRRQIKGLFGAFLNDNEFIPYGQNGFYYSILDDSSPKLGVKVYYSLGRKIFSQENIMTRILKSYTRCYEAGISPKPISLTEVKLDISVDGQKVNLSCFGLIIEKACYHESSLENLARGEFYDFNCLDEVQHPKHNSQDFKKFRHKANKIISKLGIGGCGTKLGDIIYCMNNKRWYVVDCG